MQSLSRLRADNNPNSRTANLKPPITAARYFLETQQCDHFQGSADTNPGSQKPDILANFKPPITAARYSLETQQCDHFQGSADTNPGSQKNVHFGEFYAPYYSC